MLNPAAALAGVDPLLMAGAAAMTFGAAYIRGLTGFGMAIILVPLLGLIVTPGEAVVLGILLQVLIGPVGLKIIYADADRKSAITIAAFAVVATPLGIWLLKQTTPDIARLLIAAIAIGAFLLVLLPQKPGFTPGPKETAATGIASGILTGFAAMPGPPVVPFYLRQQIAPADSARVDDAGVFRDRDCGHIVVLRLGPCKLAAGVVVDPAVPADAARQLARREILRQSARALVADICRGCAGPCGPFGGDTVAELKSLHLR